MTYRYKAANGRIQTGDVADLKSMAIHRVVAALEVGRRNTKALHSAGIKWVERTS